MNRDAPLLLVADIGGTHARFALARCGNGAPIVEPPAVWPVSRHDTLEMALDAFLAMKGRPRLEALAVCAAGPVEGRGEDARIRMTNCAWEISVRSLARASGVSRLRLMNDFAALALAVPELRPDDLCRIGGGEADMRAPMGVLGAGTGLGVSALVPVEGGMPRHAVLAGEGGHVDLAPGNAREMAVLSRLMHEYGHVSAERVLSGPGLVSLYTALASLEGGAAERLTASAIAERARAGSCVIACETVELFCGWLGAVAGDLALTLGAKGGIYIGGGIVPGWIAAGGLFAADVFRRRFEAKGRFGSYLAAIPVYAIMCENPALPGLARAALEAARH